MHDKAFEKGLFTLDLEYRIWSNDKRLKESEWGLVNISPFIGLQIKTREILPSHEALNEHWERVSLNPLSDQVA